MINEFIVVDVMNEAMIGLLRHKNANYEENLKIKELLKDEAIFFKIKRSEAYEILQKVGVKQDQVEEVYKKLTTSNMFYDLLNKGKIEANDENLVVKYKVYNRDDLFKKKN